jgi:hypothetical protein
MLATGLIDPLTRIWFVFRTGVGEQWDPAMGGSATLVLVTASSGLLALAVITLYLTFFPTQRYRRWVESSAPV